MPAWKMVEELHLPQYCKERSNVVFFNDPSNLCKVLRSKDVSKWEVAMCKRNTTHS